MTTYHVGQPPQPPQAPQAPRKSRWMLYAAVAVVVLLLAAAAATAGILAARHDGARPAASPSPVVLTAPEACMKLLPLLNAAAGQMTDAYEHPGRDTADLALTVDGLRALEPQAPQAWREDIRAQYIDLKAVADAHGDHDQMLRVALRRDGWLASALRLTEGCKPYALS